MERDLGIDLDGCDLREAALAGLMDRLGRAGLPPKSISNCIAALRAYCDTLRA